jgi:hypothetical protein
VDSASLARRDRPEPGGCYVQGWGSQAGDAMRWRIMLELAGADGTRQMCRNRTSARLGCWPKRILISRWMSSRSAAVNGEGGRSARVETPWGRQLDGRGLVAGLPPQGDAATSLEAGALALW